MGHWHSSRAGCARSEPSAQDIAFGLYVGKPRKEAKPARVAPQTMERPRPIGEPRLLRGLFARRAAATVAATGVALLAGVVLGQLEGPVSLGGTSYNPRASLAKPVEHGREQGRIAVASTIVAEPSTKTRLQVLIASPDEVPANSFVHVRGLPPATSLSEGYAMGPGAWAIPVAVLSRLNMNVAARASGTADVRFTLVSSGGEALAEAKTVLVIGPGSAAAPMAVASRSLDSKPDPLPLLRHVRYDVGKLAPAFLRDVPPRVAVHDRASRKRPVRHVAKRQQQLATKVRKLKGVRTVAGGSSTGGSHRPNPLN